LAQLNAGIITWPVVRTMHDGQLRLIIDPSSRNLLVRPQSNPQVTERA